MRKLMTLAAALTALVVIQPSLATAQGQKDKGKEHKTAVKAQGKKPDKAGKVQTVSTRRDRTDRTRDDRTRDNRDLGDIFRGSVSGEGKGPKFCRNGNGHPVHGRQWCVEKGFGLGNARWDRARWDDVIFRQEPRSNLEIGRDILIDILGGRVYNRLDARRNEFGVAQPLSGRWVTAEGGRRVLLVNAGRTPIAELVDADRDRRVDLVLLNFR